MRSVVLRCTRDDCRLPYARIEGGVLVIEARYHGHRHSNSISIEELMRLSERSPDIESVPNYEPTCYNHVVTIENRPTSVNNF